MGGPHRCSCAALRGVYCLTNNTHSKLLDCHAKASNAIMLEPHLGKPDPWYSISFTSRIVASVPKSKME
eukprot:1235180-Amphidinium_carterae.1